MSSTKAQIKYAHKTNPGARWVTRPTCRSQWGCPAIRFPMARSYFCKPKPDLGELIARLRCPFLPVVYVPSGRVLPLPRSTPRALVSFPRPSPAPNFSSPPCPGPFREDPFPHTLYANLPPPRIRAHRGRCLGLIGPGPGARRKAASWCEASALDWLPAVVLIVGRV